MKDVDGRQNYVHRKGSGLIPIETAQRLDRLDLLSIDRLQSVVRELYRLYYSDGLYVIEYDEGQLTQRVDLYYKIEYIVAAHNCAKDVDWLIDSNNH